jgi:uncharacterized protein
MNPEPVRLRGHHFICLQFFRGEGYSEEFVTNLTSLLEVAATEPALVVAEADDVCTACPELGADRMCASADAGGEDEIRRIDAIALDLLEIAPGDLITLAEARERLASDAIGVGRWRADACDGCAWEGVCERGWGRMLGDAERAAREEPSA